MPNTYHKADTDEDMIGLNVYYKDSKDKLCQYFVTSPIMDLEDATHHCRDQVIGKLQSDKEWRKNQAILAVVKGGKA